MPIDWSTPLLWLIIIVLALLLAWQWGHSQRSSPRTFNTDTLSKDTRIIGADEAWRALTKREKQIARLVARGLSNGEIATELGIKSGTVVGHLKNIYFKLQVHSRAELGYRIRDFVD